MSTWNGKMRVAVAFVLIFVVGSIPVMSAGAQPNRGLYYGVFGGLGDGSMRSADGTIELNPSGSVLGARVGFDKKLNAWLVGVEGDFAYSGLKGTERITISGFETAFDSDHDFIGTLRARLGKPVGQALVFATGGLAISRSEGVVAVRDMNNRQVGKTATDVADHFGIAFGAGVEVPITGRISFSGELMRVDFNKEVMSFDIGVHSTPMKEEANFDTNLIRLGLTIRR